MTPVALDMSQIHLGKGQGASGRHQECLHSLLENRRVVSAWVPLVQCDAIQGYGATLGKPRPLPSVLDPLMLCFSKL